MWHSTYISMFLSIFYMQGMAVAGLCLKLMSVSQKIFCMWLSIIRLLTHINIEAVKGFHYGLQM